MPSSEKVISPGVFTNEVDESFLPAAVGEIGAALIGPTVKGPPLIPTVVSSMSEFEQIFGGAQKSGSDSFSYLTSLTARSYLQNQNKLTVVRILDGNFTQAFANVHTGYSGSGYTGSRDMSVTGDSTGGGAADPKGYLDTEKHSAAGTKELPISFRLNTQGYGQIFNNFPHRQVFSNKEDLNLTGSSGLLISGSSDNIRWEITGTNAKKGTFNLLIRAGNDTNKRKQILETFNNLSLDPESNNYIERVVGNSKPVLSGTRTEPYIAMSGSFPNKSKYVYVTNVAQTPEYLDNNGNVNDRSGSTVGIGHYSSSLPAIGSGSYYGTFISGSSGYVGFDMFGNVTGSSAADDASAIDGAINVNFYENIDAQTQGYSPADLTSKNGGAAYAKALNLLANQDEYDINLLLMPGIISNTHTEVATKAVDMVEERGDVFLLLDPVLYGSNLTQATSQAESRDSNFAAMYWPWVQIPEPSLGKNVWVPPSVPLSGVYGFNDKVAHPWFAPAGLNRGGLDNVVMAERKLTQSNRDDLYESNVNPIATFPGQGVCVWGQKTLQKKSSALDRVNVRRLLIKLKKFIASTSRFLVFEQNTAKTRGRFLNIVNPYMEQVQSNSGLNAFKVVMDESNNTPDTIDRNQLIGQIFVQPTRTAEFIILDFTVQPSGATFPE
tara:strand:+ start:2235 stop:4226 length:1992 start_codon:yes stop_codon:yes gene_type:complete